MKAYNFQVIENIVGISLAVLFLVGYFSDYSVLLISSGVGTFLFMISQLSGQERNQFGFISMLFLGAIIGYFVSKWYHGALWVSAIYSLGQIFGLIKILSSKNELTTFLNENNLNRIGTKNIVSFAVTLIVPVILYLYLS